MFSSSIILVTSSSFSVAIADLCSVVRLFIFCQYLKGLFIISVILLFASLSVFDRADEIIFSSSSFCIARKSSFFTGPVFAFFTLSLSATAAFSFICSLLRSCCSLFFIFSLRTFSLNFLISFDFAWYSSSDILNFLSFSSSTARFRARTPAAILALSASDRLRPLFQGVFPLFAFPMRAFDFFVWEYPPLAVLRSDVGNKSASSSEDSDSATEEFFLARFAASLGVLRTGVTLSLRIFEAGARGFVFGGFTS
mmetsp:Transcript_30989/g.45817  ORF Transcript_30989/g.45817 Transcript_30989/m.45817 type:complete len:253 (+) Transcript_30989:575-1333(+)